MVVLANIISGGMRSITFVQAFQYWLKLTACSLPAASCSRSGPATAHRPAASGAADLAELVAARWPATAAAAAST